MQVNEREGEDETAMNLYLEAANVEPKLPEDQQRVCTAGLVLAMARCKELERSIHLALELDDPTTTLKLAEMLEQQDLPQARLRHRSWLTLPLCMLCWLHFWPPGQQGRQQVKEYTSTD